MAEQAQTAIGQAARHTPASDGEVILIRAGEAQSNNQDWLASWHPPDGVPDGTPHGSSGICMIGTGEIIVISEDGVHWDLPGGRPEGNETWEETLRREVLEEACATVVQARLLGFCRSACVAGPQAGQVLVRSLWRAQVDLAPWSPQFETTQRRAVVPAALVDQITMADGLARIVSRALHEAASIEEETVRSPLEVHRGDASESRAL